VTNPTIAMGTSLELLERVPVAIRLQYNITKWVEPLLHKTVDSVFISVESAVIHLKVTNYTLKCLV